jgi:hypothetical protein
MSEKSEKHAGAIPRTRVKGKAAAEIDLAPTEISEVIPAPETPEPEMAAAGATAASDAGEKAMPPVESPSDETPLKPAEMQQAPSMPASSKSANPKSASPKFVPALIGLVAGAIGGVGAFYGAGALQPASPADAALSGRLGALEQRLSALKPGQAIADVPAALVARLEKAESQASAAASQEARLKAEIDKLATALSGETAAREKAFAGFASRGGGALGLAGPAASPAEIEGLKSRLGTIENAAKALPEAVSTLGNRLQAVQPKIDSVSKDVAVLSGKLAGMAQGEALGAAQARLAAVTLLDDAFSSHKPLAQPVKMLGDLGVEASALAAFTPFIDKAAPDAKGLLTELVALKPQPKADTGVAKASMLDRLKAGAASLVEIRKTGTVTGTDDAAHLQRAERALGAGDIALALVLTGKLSKDAAPAYAPWRARAAARQNAFEAIRLQRAQALALLAKAAAAK